MIIRVYQNYREWFSFELLGFISSFLLRLVKNNVKLRFENSLYLAFSKIRLISVKIIKLTKWDIIVICWVFQTHKIFKYRSNRNYQYFDKQIIFQTYVDVVTYIMEFKFVCNLSKANESYFLNETIQILIGKKLHVNI